MNDLDKLEVKLSASQETLMRMFQFMGSKFPDIPGDIIDPICGNMKRSPWEC